jgi:uncharacterized membrane protein
LSQYTLEPNVRKLDLMIAFLLLTGSFFSFSSAQAQLPVVHAVLFYSPTCGHCQLVITETILPLMDQYGDQLQIAGMDITQEYGQTLFQSAMQKFGLASAGVPFLVFDDTYMIGSLDIPEKFPGIVKSYLAQGGLDWPDLPGLDELLTQAAITASTIAGGSTSPAATVLPPSTATQPASVQTASPSLTATPTSVPIAALPTINPSITHNSTWKENFARDAAGNTLSVLVLAGMLAAIAWVLVFPRGNGQIHSKNNRTLLVPMLSVVGFAVAGYLAYVETTQVSAVCGPVGDCNTVQQSEYARLLGILPIGIIGLAGYAGILVAWLYTRCAADRQAQIAWMILFGMAYFGTLFSIYLTFLEPFVIGATCAWCLTSSILITALMLLSAGPAKYAYSRNPILASARRRRSRPRSRQ